MLGFFAMLVGNLSYCAYKYRDRLKAMLSSASDAAAAAAAAGGEEGDDEGDDDPGKGQGEGEGGPEEMLVDFMDNQFTKGLDDSDLLEVNPVMMYRMNQAKKRARAAAAAAKRGLSVEEADAENAGSASSAAVGSGRPGGLARLGFKLSKAGAQNEAKANQAKEIKGIEVFLSKELDIDVKHSETKNVTRAGEKGKDAFSIATSGEHLSNIGRVGGRRGSMLTATAAAAREQLKNTLNANPARFQPKPDESRGSRRGSAMDERYRQSMANQQAARASSVKVDM
jgi:hypothetical protein